MSDAPTNQSQPYDGSQYAETSLCPIRIADDLSPEQKQQIKDALQAHVDKVTEAIRTADWSTLFASGCLPRLDMNSGGLVGAGSPYLVGERGPEIVFLLPKSDRVQWYCPHPDNVSHEVTVYWNGEAESPDDQPD